MKYPHLKLLLLLLEAIIVDPIYYFRGGGGGGDSKGSMEPPFERVSLTQDTLIEQSQYS